MEYKSQVSDDLEVRRSIGEHEQFLSDEMTDTSNRNYSLVIVSINFQGKSCSKWCSKCPNDVQNDAQNRKPLIKMGHRKEMVKMLRVDMLKPSSPKRFRAKRMGYEFLTWRVKFKLILYTNKSFIKQKKNLRHWYWHWSYSFTRLQ